MASILGFFSVSPACAGMIPPTGAFVLWLPREPRMRGDDPEDTENADKTQR